MTREEKDAGHGRIFLGRDETTYGEEGIGWVAYDPDFECGGTMEDNPDRQCPFLTESRHIRDQHPDADVVGDDKQMALKGSEGRLFHVGIASFRYVKRRHYNMSRHY
jgi:hypothetical protein